MIAEKETETLRLPSSLSFPTWQVTSYYLKVKNTNFENFPIAFGIIWAALWYLKTKIGNSCSEPGFSKTPLFM